jgi:hypothetical protein
MLVSKLWQLTVAPRRARVASANSSVVSIERPSAS